ncbi:hypothetical protein IAE22_30675, partial [Bacillus sp. S34]|nr:hypothetical protein [Bacillus sp. S34]
MEILRAAWEHYLTYGAPWAALAAALRDAGLRWHPTTGDRFVIDKPGVDDDVYTVSEMTVERHDYPSGTVLGFNGTTEWALDSVDA